MLIYITAIYTDITDTGNRLMKTNGSIYIVRSSEEAAIVKKYSIISPASIEGFSRPFWIDFGCQNGKPRFTGYPDLPGIFLPQESR